MRPPELSPFNVITNPAATLIVEIGTLVGKHYVSGKGAHCALTVELPSKKTVESTAMEASARRWR